MAEKNENSIYKALTNAGSPYIDIYPNRSLWLELEEEIGGEFKVIFTKSRDVEKHRFRLPYKKWIIEFYISESRPLKVKAEFPKSKDFKLIISLEDFIERIFKKFRKPKLQLGWDPFDNRYLIETDQPDHIKRVLNRETQKIILEHNIYSISYQLDSSNKAELLCVIQRNPAEKEEILQFIKMFQQIIDGLENARII